MAIIRRIKAAAFAFAMRMAPRRPVDQQELTRADHSPHPGGKGLRMTERVRDAFRASWLRLRK